MKEGGKDGRREYESAEGRRGGTGAYLQYRTTRQSPHVSISTSSLHRVLRPHLTLQTDLSDGTSHCFYASKERFDELRYTVARLINDMQGAEARLPPLVEAAVDRRGSVQ